MPALLLHHGLAGDNASPNPVFRSGRTSASADADANTASSPDSSDTDMERHPPGSGDGPGAGKQSAQQRGQQPPRRGRSASQPVPQQPIAGPSRVRPSFVLVNLFSLATQHLPPPLRLLPSHQWRIPLLICARLIAAARDRLWVYAAPVRGGGRGDAAESGGVRGGRNCASVARNAAAATTPATTTTTATTWARATRSPPRSVSASRRAGADTAAVSGSKSPAG